MKVGTGIEGPPLSTFQGSPGRSRVAGIGDPHGPRVVHDGLHPVRGLEGVPTGDGGDPRGQRLEQVIGPQLVDPGLGLLQESAAIRSGQVRQLERGHPAFGSVDPNREFLVARTITLAVRHVSPHFDRGCDDLLRITWYTRRSFVPGRPGRRVSPTSTWPA